MVEVVNMLAAAAASANPTISLPLSFFAGIILYLLLRDPRVPRFLLVGVAVLFGASAAQLILAISDGLQKAFQG